MKLPMNWKRYSAIVFGSSVIAIAMYVLGAAQAVAAPNSGFWCFTSESHAGDRFEVFCNPVTNTGDIDKVKARCDSSRKNVRFSNTSQCQHVDRPEDIAMIKDNDTYFTFDESRQQFVYTNTKNLCKQRDPQNGAGCIQQTKGGQKTTAFDSVAGTQWCYLGGSGRTYCFDTEAECKLDRNKLSDPCKKENHDTLFCMNDDGAVRCMTNKEDCLDYGIEFGLSIAENTCMEIQTSNATIQSSQPSVIAGSIPAPNTLEYIPLEDTFFKKEHALLPNLLKYLFNVGIWIVGLAALFMLMIGGATYLLSAGNTATMGSAKNIMRDAILGLVLALGSWLLLYVINPDLVGIGENLEKLVAVSPYKEKLMDSTAGGPSGGGGAGAGGGGGAGAGGGGGAGAGTTDADYILRENNKRAELQAAGVGVKSNTCQRPNQSNCTAVADLPRKSIDALIGLKKECPNCEVFVTGGTEGGHATHGPGKNVFDLRINNELEAYFFLNGTENKPISQYGNTTNAENWTITSGPLSGAHVVKETNPPHYHVYWP